MALEQSCTEYNGEHKDFDNFEELTEYLDSIENEYREKFYFKYSLDRLASEAIANEQSYLVIAMGENLDLTIDFKYNELGKKLFYWVEWRNGYWAIDEYLNTNGDQFSNLTRFIESFKTRKLAESVCYRLNELAFKVNELQSFKEGIEE